MEQKKKKLKKTIIILLGIILFIVAFCFYLKWKLPLERTNYKSYEEYVESGAIAQIEIPESATDVRFYHNNLILTKQSVYSFIISDNQEYDIFMEFLKNEICTEWGGTHPQWSNELIPYCTYPYTEEEREEMTYLQENFMDMNYEEILTMSRHKYGFAYGYGASVTDYIELDNQIEQFPIYECFDEVMDDNLEDYTILNYDAWDGSYHGVIVNEETRRFIIFNYVVW